MWQENTIYWSSCKHRPCGHLFSISYVVHALGCEQFKCRVTTEKFVLCYMFYFIWKFILKSVMRQILHISSFLLSKDCSDCCRNHLHISLSICRFPPSTSSQPLLQNGKRTGAWLTHHTLCGFDQTAELWRGFLATHLWGNGFIKVRKSAELNFQWEDRDVRKEDGVCAEAVRLIFYLTTRGQHILTKRDSYW